TMKLLDLYYNKAYRRAGDETAISWHRDEPPALLRKAVESLNGRAQALDIGCGTGVNAVFMAQHGLQVMAVDFLPEALAFAVRRAERFGVKVNFIRADVTRFDAPVKYDLVVDAGCFHGFDEKLRLKYRAKLMEWLQVGAQYVLIHSGKRHAFDLSIIGTRARRKVDIERYFASELKLDEFLPDTAGKPLFQYRFRRVGNSGIPDEKRFETRNKK
ncbi:MAG TPA: class I SAM-dependent methyltransferase, partial [Candidatus Kryptobacter bacterium]|nr:class I SAM-dependent methyltransferase [Candidatus Kryptobacter bacterium]